MISCMRSANLELVESFTVGQTGFPVGVPSPVVNNIKVAPEVSNLAGAYFVQREVPNNPTTGNIAPTEPVSDSDTPLTINGSVYGNIGPLFEHRIGSGDVAQIGRAHV